MTATILSSSGNAVRAVWGESCVIVQNGAQCARTVHPSPLKLQRPTIPQQGLVLMGLHHWDRGESCFPPLPPSLPMVSKDAGIQHISVPSTALCSDTDSIVEALDHSTDFFRATLLTCCSDPAQHLGHHRPGTVMLQDEISLRSRFPSNRRTSENINCMQKITLPDVVTSTCLRASFGYRGSDTCAICLSMPLVMLWR